MDIKTFRPLHRSLVMNLKGRKEGKKQVRKKRSEEGREGEEGKERGRKQTKKLILIKYFQCAKSQLSQIMSPHNNIT